MSIVTLTMALVMGLTGSLHCAGMCGPIVWVMPFQMMNGFRRWLGIGLYHFGRISIYALLGFMLYAFKSVFQPQWQQYISIVLGVMLLLIGIISFIPNRKLSIKLPWTEWIKKKTWSIHWQPFVPHFIRFRYAEWYAALRIGLYGAIREHYCT